MGCEALIGHGLRRIMGCNGSTNHESLPSVETLWLSVEHPWVVLLIPMLTISSFPFHT